MRRTARRRLTHEPQNSSRVQLSEIPANGTHFCHYGTWHGNDTDLSRCVVVQLLLNGNNLGGRIDQVPVEIPSEDHIDSDGSVSVSRLLADPDKRAAAPKKTTRPAQDSSKCTHRATFFCMQAKLTY